MKKLFAACAPGLEPFTANELQQLSINSNNPIAEFNSLSKSVKPNQFAGGVEFTGDLEMIYRTNLYLRTASRILVRFGEFFASGFPELKRKVAQLPWENYLRPKQPVALRVTCHKSRLYHSGAVAQRITEAIGKRLGALPTLVKFDENAAQNPPQLIVVRIARNRCTISIDSSGAVLHRRGYRLATAKAPLRETLAAGMLLAAGWDKKSPLFDPFCGSGTIAIEAALMAKQKAPGINRKFAFMGWPNFDREKWQNLVAMAKAPAVESAPLITASDRDAGAIQSARENAERTGVKESITLYCRTISAIDPPGQTGWIVTNPPYGVRLNADKDLRNLYAKLGSVLRNKCAGWRVAMLCNSDSLLRQTGLKFDTSILLDNGGVKVTLAVGKIND